MTVHTFYFNPYRECTYVLYDSDTATATPEQNQPCIIIDAGMYSNSEQERFAHFLNEHHLSPTTLLITHSHPDHICGVEWLRTTYHLEPLPLNFDQKDDKVTPLQPLPEGCQILFTPGHHPDCVCYYWPKEDILFTGDTLFCESVGRTDLPGGDMSLLMKSLKQLMQLPQRTTVYPGHGVPTTIGHEQENNPYL